MNFEEMRDKLNEHLTKMTQNGEHLFSVLLDKDVLWNLYLDSFPEGTNEIFRERRWHDCSCCRGFIKQIGDVVAIKDGKIETIWDVELNDDVYAPVFKKLSEFVKSNPIVDVFVSSEPKVGCHHNFESMVDAKVKQWDHFFFEYPKNLVVRGTDKGTIVGQYRDTRNVFKRSLDEISLEALNIVIDLINDDNLYRGHEWKNQLVNFRKFKIEYDRLSDSEKELYTWEKSVNIGAALGRLRNHSIGTLLVDISTGTSLETAIRKYDQMVAPSNYKRSKPIFTQKMLDDAKKDIEEMGYMDSLSRRFATLDDITVNDILFSNKDAAKRISGAADIFGELSRNTANDKTRQFSKSPEVSATDFINNILPNCESVEVFLENSFAHNFMSLIAPANKDSKSLFKWGNSFSWVYSGNLTDSDIKQNVKNAGGKVDGDLRFSLQWNENGKDIVDLDAHCLEPNGHEIFYNSKVATSTRIHTRDCGLDVDMIRPHSIGVENIVFNRVDQMAEGIYRFSVVNFDGNRCGSFKCELECKGTIYTFECTNVPGRSGVSIPVVDVMLKDGVFTVNDKLPSTISSKTIWNVTTNDFVPVTAICYSPNYWDKTDCKTGLKHLFFMLKDCINDETPSGIFNEFIVQDLDKHRKVIEALSDKLRVDNANDQLSGIGFTFDKRQSVVVKVNNKDVYKVNF